MVSGCQFSKFQRLRKKNRGGAERTPLKKVLADVEKDPNVGKKLKGEFAPMRLFPYTVEGQPRRLIYKWSKDMLVLFPFGPKQGIYRSRGR